MLFRSDTGHAVIDALVAQVRAGINQDGKTRRQLNQRSRAIAEVSRVLRGADCTPTSGNRDASRGAGTEESKAHRWTRKGFRAL